MEDDIPRSYRYVKERNGVTKMVFIPPYPPVFGDYAYITDSDINDLIGEELEYWLRYCFSYLPSLSPDFPHPNEIQVLVKRGKRY
jgi:hypothetical protein